MAKSISGKQTSATPHEGAGAPRGRVVVAGPEEGPTVPMFYANNTSVETSLWDVCLKFAETIETDREQNITKVRELLRVRISPQHARVVVGILTRHLENYERDFGPIPSKQQAGPETKQLR